MTEAEETLTTPPPAARTHQFALPFAALAAGAMAMGASPIFVRLADVGPFASAFWRMALSLPMFWAWLAWERARLRGHSRPGARPEIIPARDWRAIGLIGFLFAGDLFFWHLSILNTTIANATLLATTTPIIVTIGAWAFLKEQLSPRILAGVALGVTGAALLVGLNVRIAPDKVLGDLFAVMTACFFGTYFIVVAHARRRMSAAQVMFYPAIVTTGLLFLAAVMLDDRLMPRSLEGVATLASLAFVSQLGGQGLAAYALGHLPAVFSSLVLFFEAIAAGGLAWLLFAEPVSPWQAAGGALILAGIYAARPEKTRKGRKQRSMP